jgi:hypothetical protein
MAWHSGFARLWSCLHKEAFAMGWKFRVVSGVVIVGLIATIAGVQWRNTHIDRALHAGAATPGMGAVYWQAPPDAPSTPDRPGKMRFNGQDFYLLPLARGNGSATP